MNHSKMAPLENKDASQESHPLPRRVFVVDDDETIGPLIQAALKGHSEVTQISSGAQAAITAASRHPDLILLDLRMPNIDGYEVLRQFKQHPSTAGIPIICMSADPDDLSRTRAFDLGAIGSLTKPLDIQRLPVDIASLLALATEFLDSPSRRRRVVIAFNRAEKNRLIKEEILARARNGAKVVLLTLSPGHDFCDETLDTLIRNQDLTYLQIRASLIAKFPYLQDLTPITSELRTFLNGGAPHYTLLFDEPNLILLSQPGDASGIARAHALREALAHDFGDILFFFCRGNSRDSSTLNELAHALVK